MDIKILEDEFSVLQYEKMPENIPEIHFIAVTEDEISVLCKSHLKPENAKNCEDGFRGMKILGSLEFSLVGIISRLTTILADNDIPVFVVSTFNTDYIFVKNEYLPLATQLLMASGYNII